MFKNKLLKTSVVATFMLFALTKVSYAAGWEETDGAWKYQKADGTYASNTWATSGDDWYYLGSDEKTLSNTLVEDNDHLYYVDETGKMVRDKWVSFIDDESTGDKTWYYFDSAGKALKGRGDRVAPKVIDGKQYIFDADGKLKTGFLTETGEAVDDSEGYKFLNAVYYAGEDGALYSDQWLLYTDVGEHGVTSELSQRSYNEYNEIWLYFDSKGKKVKAKDTTAPKLKEINGANYSFDEYGAVIPGLALTNPSQVGTNSNATVRYGSTDNDGAQKSDYWTFAVPNEAMDSEDYHNQEFSWFRTRKDGKVYQSRIVDVLGRKYAFDNRGRMLTAFVVMKPDGSYGKQYDIDVFEKADFLVGKGEGTDTGSLLFPLQQKGAKLYLFGTDELNDGSMKTGEDITVVLKDGEAHMGFRPNGVAYGNGYTLERKNNKYYYNGLRLDADSEIGYASVKDTRNSNDTYVVVDVLGRLVKGKKRIIQDNEGYFILIKDDKFYARVDSGEKPRWKDGKFYYYDSSLDKDNRFTGVIKKNTGAESKGFNIAYDTTY